MNSTNTTSNNMDTDSEVIINTRTHTDPSVETTTTTTTTVNPLDTTLPEIRKDKEPMNLSTRPAGKEAMAWGSMSKTLRSSQSDDHNTTIGRGRARADQHDNTAPTIERLASQVAQLTKTVATLTRDNKHLRDQLNDLDRDLEREVGKRRAIGQKVHAQEMTIAGLSTTVADNCAEIKTVKEEIRAPHIAKEAERRTNSHGNKNPSSLGAGSSQPGPSQPGSSNDGDETDSQGFERVGSNGKPPKNPVPNSTTNSYADAARTRGQDKEPASQGSVPRTLGGARYVAQHPQAGRGGTTSGGRASGGDNSNTTGGGAVDGQAGNGGAKKAKGNNGNGNAGTTTQTQTKAKDSNNAQAQAPATTSRGGKRTDKAIEGPIQTLATELDNRWKDLSYMARKDTVIKLMKKSRVSTDTAMGLKPSHTHLLTAAFRFESIFDFNRAVGLPAICPELRKIIDQCIGQIDRLYVNATFSEKVWEAQGNAAATQPAGPGSGRAGSGGAGGNPVDKA